MTGLTSSACRSLHDAGWIRVSTLDDRDSAGHARHMHEAVILMTTPAVMAASVGNVAVTSLAGQLSIEHLDELERVFREHQQRWGSANLSLTLVKGHVPLPDAATRARLQAMHTSGTTADVACVVVDADGFWAAAARGVLAGIALVSRKAPHAARTLDEALQWAVTHLPAGAPDVRAAAPAIAQLRQRHIAQASGIPTPSTSG
jgi:hypothetical protein